MVDNYVSMAAPPSGKGSSSRPPAAPQVVTADASVGAANTGAEAPLDRANTDGSDEYLGKTFGKYRVTKRLGNGGMAVVYQAEDLLMKRQVAIKFLSGAFLHKPAAIERFMREAQVAGRLSHPNIIAIHDVSKEARACFIVMELLSPGSAGQHLKQKGPYYWVVATRIITDCCAALKVAHDAGVVHRGLMPSLDSSLMRADLLAGEAWVKRPAKQELALGLRRNVCYAATQWMTRNCLDDIRRALVACCGLACWRSAGSSSLAHWSA